MQAKSHRLTKKTELLRQAEQLVQQKMHPQVVIKGYRIATEAARAALKDVAFDNGKSTSKLRPTTNCRLVKLGGPFGNVYSLLHQDPTRKSCGSI